MRLSVCCLRNFHESSNDISDWLLMEFVLRNLISISFAGAFHVFIKEDIPMTKKIKTYSKKTLSVLMAALMLITAWVFVAPEKAEGISQSGSYTWRVRVNCSSSVRSGGWNSETLKVYGKGNNGTGSETTLFTKNNWYLDFTGWRENTWGEGDQTTTEFPTKVTYTGNFGGGLTWYTCTATMYLDVYNGSEWVNVGSGNISGSSSAFSSGTATGSITVASGNCPKADNVVCSSAFADKTVPNSGTVYSTGDFYCKDQYGVRLCNTSTGISTNNNYGWYSQSVSGSESGTNGLSMDATNYPTNVSSSAESASSSTFRVKITNSAKFHSGDYTASSGKKDQTVTVTVVYKFNGVTATGTGTFTLTNPKYSYTLDHNSDDIIDTNDDEHPITIPYSKGLVAIGSSSALLEPPTIETKKYYYYTFGTTPVGYRRGFEFKGVYDTDENSDNYNTSSWTPSGNKLTSSTNITADKTYYAAWQAREIIAKFEDIDGNLLATVKGRYNKSIAGAEAVSNLNSATWKTGSSYANGIAYPLLNQQSGTYDYVFDHWESVDAKIYKGYDPEKKDTWASLYSSTNRDNWFDNYPAGTSLEPTSVFYGDVVFRPVYSIRKHNYTVKYWGLSGNTPLQSGTNYTYGQTVTPPTAPTKAQDNTFTYQFKGWTPVSSSSGAGAFIVDENGCNVNGGAYVPLADTADFIVKHDAYYQPVFERIYRDYTVTFQIGSTTTTATGHYGASVDVPEAASYKAEGYEYTFIGTWKKTLNGSSSNVTLGSTVTIDGNATYKANYDDGVATNYTVRFYDYDANGELRLISEKTDYIYNDNISSQLSSAVTQVNQSYRDGTYEYSWPKTGDPDDIFFEDINGNPLESFAVTDDMDWYAAYDANLLYTISYYNDDVLMGTLQQVEGKAIPAWDGETPEKADDAYATNYEFEKWVDEDGNDVSAMPAGDISLYAKYTMDVTDYTIKFINFDHEGEPIDYGEPQTLHYGDEIVVPENPTRLPDNKYKYEFKGWDKAIQPTVNDIIVSQCDENKTVTYTAEYRKGYVYYDVIWWNEDGSVIKSEKYIYNERITPPYTDPDPVTTTSDDPNYTPVFDKWVYVTDNGTEISDYVRGDRVSDNVILKAKFTLAPATKNVKFFDEDGTTLLAEKTVAYGKTLGEIETILPVKAATAEKHFTFDKWLTMTGEAAPSSTSITDHMSFKASYAEADHSMALDAITVAPTFWAEGEAEWSCSVCGKEETRHPAALTDTVAPTAAIFVRNNAWRTAYDADFMNATPVSGMNFVTLAANDTANVDTNYNPDGSLGSGFATIDYAIVDSPAKAANPATIDAGEWVSVFSTTKPTELEDIDGNLTDRLSSIAPDVADGEEFIIVTKIVDKKGNTTYFYTGTLIMDNTEPVVEVTSEFCSGSKHCLGVTISAEDANEIESVKVDGVALTAGEGGAYTYETAGLHQAAVTDIAGNTTLVNFEIVGQHNTKATTVAPTCTEAGYSVNICSLCKTEIGAQTEIPSPGHNEATRTIPATCTEDAIEITYCTVCMEELSRRTLEGTALNHDWKEYYKKAATCADTGILEEKCSRCGEIKTTELPIDETAHSYYRPVTVSPTCTEAGRKYEVCKYCSEEHIIFQGSDAEAENYNEAYAPTGHVATGTWVVTQEPSCTEPGTKVQYCKYHNDVPVETDSIEPLGHHYVKFSVVEPTSTSSGYTVYKCTRCEDSYNGDYVDALVPFTVTFVVDGVESDPITVYQGESITAAEAPNTDKAADLAYTYTFSGWKDQDDNDVTLPLIVNKNYTLTAQYNAKAINYTITLMKEDGDSYDEFYKVGYCKHEEVVDLSTYTLTKDSDVDFDYEFKGWASDASAEPEDASFSYTINGSDVTLYPIFKATARSYSVVFALNNTSPALATVTVPAGGTAVYPDTAPTPEKEFDSNAHYVFEGNWSKPLTNITEDTIVYAQFTAKPHVTAETAGTTAATCTESGKITYACECGYSYSVATDPLGHLYSGDPVENAEGKLGWICQRAGCGEFIEDTTTYTVKFMPDEGSIAIKTIAYLPYGADISDRLPDTPTKAADSQWEYTFDFWADSEGNEVTVNTIVKANAIYYAHFSKTPITHIVVFAIDADHVLKTYTVDNGFAVQYDGDEPVADASTANSYGHLVFDGWNGAPDDGYVENITTDMYITAKFRRENHTYSSSTTSPTCTEFGKVIKTCDCGYSYEIKGEQPLGHDYVLVGQTGQVAHYVCSRCGDPKDETIPDTSVIAVIKVVNSDGSPVEGAKVSLYDGSTFINSGTTGSDGIVRLKVPEAKTYTIVIESTNGSFTDQTGTIKVNGDGSTAISGVNIEVHHCACACHKDGIWGTLFRFFHKIIKLITGKYTCCDDPDPRYRK